MTPEAVLEYWFGKAESELAAKQKLWFDGGPAIDSEIREKFGAEVAAAQRGELREWHATPRGTLAWIILIDQFSRNVHRNKPEAFAADHLVLAVARDGFDRRTFDALTEVERCFAILPFTHAEDLEAQKRGCALYVRNALGARAEFRTITTGNVDWARKHLDVIARFGRFPHRNAVLGRTSTPEEQAYLDYSKLVGQWL